LHSNLAEIAKRVALNGVLPDIAADNIFANLTVLTEIPKGVVLLLMPKN